MKVFVASSFDEKHDHRLLKLKRTLEDMGYEVLIGRNCDEATISSTVKQRIISSRCMVALMARQTQKPNSQLWETHGWVRDEVGFAVGVGVPVLRVLEEGVDESGIAADHENIRFSDSNLDASLLRIAAFVSRKGLRNAVEIQWTRRGLAAAFFSAVTLGVILTALYMNATHVPRNKLFTFSGMKELRKASVFQDFAPKGEPQKNVVSFMWADAFHDGVIRAHVIRETAEKTPRDFLRVEFKNVPPGYPANVAVRSKDNKATNVGSEYRSLMFDARMAPMKSLAAAKDRKPIQINIRIVDGKMTHWNYETNHGPIHFHLEPDSDWMSFTADLSTSGNWKKFGGDGNENYAEAAPDLAALSSVIFEFGDPAAERPGGGEGIIDISNIRFK